MQMLSFRQFLEMGEIVTADVSNIQLRRTDYGYKYVFHDDDGEKYEALFYADGIHLGPKKIPGFSIEFDGPAGMSLTNKYKANQVYRQLMMAVKKLIEEVNPDALNFSGASDEQTIMYDTFYKRFLSKVYKRVNKYDYVSNGFIEKMRTSNPQQYQRLQQKIADNDETVGKYIGQLRQQKIADRGERNAMMAQSRVLQSAGAGKLAWGDGAKLVYIKDVIGDTVSAYRYDTISNNVVLQRFIASSIKPFTQYPMGFPAERIKGWVDSFTNALRAKGIQVQGYYEGV